jgi:predicted aspartyl protease
MKLIIASALAAAGLALAHPASAGITCNLTDQRGNALQYSFARGGHGYTNETVVKRNGVILSNGGPMWTRSSNSAERTMTLQQGDWSLVYEAKPNDTDISRAALFINTRQKAAGTCVADYSVDTPYTPPDVPSAPAPAPSYASPAPSSGNPVGIITGSHGAAVEVMLGSHPALMQIDTGAGMTSLTAKVAHELLDAGEAHYSGESHLFTMANGTTSNEQEIVIDRLQIGTHTLYSVHASVSPDEGMMLLGYDVLDQMGGGRFTIDRQSNLLIFG